MTEKIEVGTPSKMRAVARALIDVGWNKKDIKNYAGLAYDIEIKYGKAKVRAFGVR
jgi:hypothetical protein